MRGSYYSGGRTIRGGRSNRGSTVHRIDLVRSVTDNNEAKNIIRILLIRSEDKLAA